MLPVAIFRHSPTEGPGYFAIFLEQHGIPWQLIAIDEGEPVPTSADEFSGLCFMGGPMSVNDPLPWIAPVCALIGEAVRKNIPVIGHCLGGQLMSKALGGRITRNPVKEIGWGLINGESNTTAHHWLGDFSGRSGMAFHWHGETFSLPEGANLLAGNRHCTNQIFASGPHLGMQCHVEMTPEMIAKWCEQWDDERVSPNDRESAQAPKEMLGQIDEHLPAMRQLSEQLYSVWIQGLAR